MEQYEYILFDFYQRQDMTPRQVKLHISLVLLEN